MKKTTLLLVLLTVIQYVNAESASKPTKGSTDAAIQMVGEYLGRTYNAPKMSVTRAAILESAADSLTIKANFGSKVCTMRLQKHASANEFGWVVQQHRCAPELIAG